MATEKTASFSIPIKAESNTREEADKLEELKSRIIAAQSAVKDYSASLRTLRGSSDEVKEAKERLKASLNAEKDAISRSTIEILKQGSSLEKLKRQEDEAARAAEKLKNSSIQVKKSQDDSKRAHEAAGKAIDKIGGPVKSLREGFDSLKQIMGGMEGAEGAVSVGFAAIGVAVVAVTVAVVAATIAFGKFVLAGANAARTAGLMREAASGSAENAEALGHQIDALGRKVPTARAELQELAVSMTRALLGTRVSGQGLVDTFNAVAQASSAMGSEAASKIQGIIDRSKTWGRMGLGRFELQGTGISFEDVAGNLSKQLKIGLDDARLQLLAGWVDVNQGAKAIRTAIEQRFASINLRKMLDFNVLKQKLSDAVSALTRGVDIEPFLKSLQSLFSLFDTTTMAGAALKDVVTDLGTALMGKAAGGADLAKFAIKQLIIWALELDIAFLKTKKSVTSAGEGLRAGSIAMSALKASAMGLTAVGAGLGVVLSVIATALLAIPAAIGAVIAGGEQLIDWGFEINDWAVSLGTKLGESFRAFGVSIVEGIVSGIERGWDALKRGVTNVAERIKGAFKDALGIHSPSAVFRAYGQQTVAGYAEGVDSAGGAAQGSIDRMAPAPAATAASSPGRSGPVHLEVNIMVGDGGKGHETAKALSAPDFLSQLTKAIEEALVGAGIPTQQPAGG